MSVEPVTLPRGQQSYNQLVAAVETLLNQLARHPMANAKVIGPVTLGFNDFRVYHGLGQRPRGYFVVSLPSIATVYDGAGPETSDPSNYITLRASAVVTVTLVVF